MRPYDGGITVGGRFFDLRQRWRWRTPVGLWNLHVLALAGRRALLHLLDKLFIAKKYLPVELCPWRRRFDPLGHELRVAISCHVQPLCELRQ